MSVATRRRARVRVEGTVQGVGFRPYVHRLAGELGLAGYVLNDSRGVLLEIEGLSDAVETFLARLGPDAPPLALLESMTVVDREPTGDAGFQIRPSPHGDPADVPVTPDSATCDDCLRELLDPSDRRHRYPFINCTNCGPRFTIVRGVPYDRPLTTMAGFEMCSECRAEYENPDDRRFHAQPNACPKCGPSLSLLDADGRAVGRCDAALAAAVDALRGGKVVAIKGIGGYHLACRADDEAAVAALRARKHREDKPFALMVASVGDAEVLVGLGDAERKLLSGPQRPIVLAERRIGGPVAESVAPGALELGVMLAYSPLHHLLLRDCGAGALVMTSGNVSDEPIAYRDEDAVERLGAIADLLLVHDRPIETRTDDSVARIVAGPRGPRPLFVRRSRGYVPAGLMLPGGTPRPVLACGAELKNTFCLARGNRAWVGHHVGDLENYETLESFTEGIEHFERLFAVAPEIVAHDLHPEYLSTKYARERDGVELIGVQHHHAHLAACLAEHGEQGTAVGAIFDGSGYGTDGAIWGGELLVGGVCDFSRAGHLRAIRMPGGERAIREPWRVACAWLTAADATPPRALRELVPERTWAQVAGLVRSGVASPMTTSMGRLFDAVSALCGLRTVVNYEGQAAIELEAACDPNEGGRYQIELESVDGVLVLDPRELIRGVCADLTAGVAPGLIGSRFHAAVAAVTVEACVALAAANGTDVVVLSGGVFLNRRLLESVCAGLDARGLRVLTPERLPIGDGGISYGQAAVATRRLAAA
ncbi:MAG TPA: carbamoyltransferase HypF [Solirubrobacteraceae bacterium]|nr:carbamoyltransferase HypF [Solirubrobacteraceae bacterium]